MRIEVDSKDLLAIAEEIRRNCDMLSYTDAEDAEDDIGFYVPVIRSLAENIVGILRSSEHAPETSQEAI